MSIQTSPPAQRSAAAAVVGPLIADPALVALGYVARWARGRYVAPDATRHRPSETAGEKP